MWWWMSITFLRAPTWTMRLLRCVLRCEILLLDQDVMRDHCTNIYCNARTMVV